MIDAIVPDDYLAASRSVDFHSRIVHPGSSRRSVAEDHTASTLSEDFTGATVIRRIEAKGLSRRAGFDESLNYSVRAPGLCAARLQDKWDLQRNGRNPE